MDKIAKATVAADNSARHLSKTFNYSAVDGRVYRTEEKLPSTTPNFKDFYKRMGHGFPSLIEVYRCDHYLSGKGIFYKTSVPAKEKDWLLQELNMAFNPTMQRYTASAEGIWEYFKDKYPEKLEQERITSYSELVYRSKNRR